MAGSIVAGAEAGSGGAGSVAGSGKIGSFAGALSESLLSGGGTGVDRVLRLVFFGECFTGGISGVCVEVGDGTTNLHHL